MKTLSNMKKNKQAPLSKSSEKKGDLLIQVDELMQKLENQYGPLMLEELQKRLLKTINDFQDDVNTTLEDTFNKHQIKYQSLDRKLSDSEDNEGVPSFISEYQNKQKKKR